MNNTMTGDEILTYLLEQIENGANIDTKDNFGNTALIYASSYNELDICEWLLNNGANINTQGNYGYNSLICASKFGYIRVCRLLISNGANLNLQDNNSNTALMEASYFWEIDLCRLLIENGADVNIQNNFGYTAIEIMKREGIYEYIEPIINRMEGIKYFKEIFREYAEAYLDIFETTLYSQELELNDIKANIEMFYSNVIDRIADSTINENLEL